MYCVFNATTTNTANSGNPLGWPLEQEYGYFCDQRDKGLFMLSNGLANLLGIVGAYLLTVLFIGPKLMANRKPLEVKNLIRFYNATMIFVNLYLINRALAVVDNGRSFFNCKGVEMDYGLVDEIALISELFLLSRLADFLDTIWLVLRKKHTHMSFLHVFHHSYVPLVTYAATRWDPVAPNAMSFPFLNCAVHAVTYLYYLLATFPALRPYLWWKRYLTSLQITQFATILTYNVFGYFYFSNVCGNSQTAALLINLISAVIFLALYKQFYKRAYTTTQAKKQEEKSKSVREKTSISSSSSPSPSISRTLTSTTACSKRAE